VDAATGAIYAVDMTPLIARDAPEPGVWAREMLDTFSKDVIERVGRLA
jgi:hypothetical protein